MMRIGLFLLTNLAVLVVFGIVFSILSAFFGLGSVHGAGGVNFGSLAVMCAVWYGGVNDFTVFIKMDGQKINRYGGH